MINFGLCYNFSETNITYLGILAQNTDLEEKLILQYFEVDSPGIKKSVL